MPGSTTCLNCPFPECINSLPPVKGEGSIEKYVNLVDGKKGNAMKTKYSIGEIVKIEATVVKIEADKKGVKYFLSSKKWNDLKIASEDELAGTRKVPAKRKNAVKVVKTEEKKPTTKRRPGRPRKQQAKKDNIITVRDDDSATSIQLLARELADSI